ncbi:Aldo/keto reductase [Mycena kentingensis (nom. inval.)]|nr:Aldo/keto reductase [Mycena kentingensis (nom. inval.)]
MPWDALQTADGKPKSPPYASMFSVNAGSYIPGLSFATSGLQPNPVASEQLKEALKMGIVHIEICNFNHATELRKIMEKDRIPRSNVFLSARWQHSTEPIAAKTVERLLKILNFETLDLLIMNEPKAKIADIGPRWAQMEKAKQMGLVRNIGVLNFDRDQMVEVFIKAKHTSRPAVNQLPAFNPYADPAVLEVVELCRSLGVVIMAGEILQPATSLMATVLTAPLTEIAKRVANGPNKIPTSAAQVLLAWAKIKGVAPMLTKIDPKWPKDILEVGHIPSSLTPIDLRLIDLIGAEKFRREATSAQKNAIYRAVGATVAEKAAGAVVNQVLGL